ncbi:hypothetical protein V2J09_022813 [Rumex salicifolius]
MDSAVQAIITDLKVSPGSHKHYSWSKDLLRRKSKLVLPNVSSIRNAILSWLHCSGTGAQHRMEQYSNSHRTDRSFEIGDWVFVKLQPYRQHLLVLRTTQKLAPNFFGPFSIIDRCGAVAYKLKLPSTSSIHPVFHISQLKQQVGNASTSSALPNSVSDVLAREPELILERKMVNRQGKAATMVLVKWTNESIEEATWEFFYDLTRRFPAFKT